MGEGAGGGWGNEQEKMERGICRREEDRRVFFSDAACSSSAFFAKSCLFDQGYVVLCVALFFFSSFFFFIVALRFHAARFHGDNKRSMAARDRQISSLYDFCDFCSSVAFTVTRLSPHCRFASWILTGFISYQFCSSSLPSVCGRQGSYQGPGISQASTMATTVPYSQPTGNNSSAMGNAQGPAYNMTPSGILA